MRLTVSATFIQCLPRRQIVTSGWESRSAAFGNPPRVSVNAGWYYTEMASRTGFEPVLPT